MPTHLKPSTALLTLSLPFNWRVPWLLRAIAQLAELRKPLLTGLVTYFKRVQFRYI